MYIQIAEHVSSLIAFAAEFSTWVSGLSKCGLSLQDDGRPDVGQCKQTHAPLRALIHPSRAHSRQ